MRPEQPPGWTATRRRRSVRPSCSSRLRTLSAATSDRSTSWVASSSVEPTVESLVVAVIWSSNSACLGERHRSVPSSHSPWYDGPALLQSLRVQARQEQGLSQDGLAEVVEVERFVGA